MRSWYRIENRSAPDTAEIYLHDEIGLFGVTSGQFVADLKSVTSPKIKLHVNSPGGSVDDGIAIYNALMSHSAEREVYVDALAASIASVIAMAASPGKLIMAPHSRMMIHEAMALGMGFAEDFDKIAQRLRDTSENIATIYAERTGKDAAHWRDLMKAETWFTDQGAVDAGLADEVGRDYAEENFRIAASFTLLEKYRAQPGFEANLITPPEQNAGRTMNATNLAKLHAAMAGLNAVHAGTCDMADGCPVGGGESDKQAESSADDNKSPETPRAAALRELEEALARVQL